MACGRVRGSASSARCWGSSLGWRMGSKASLSWDEGSSLCGSVAVSTDLYGVNAAVLMLVITLQARGHWLARGTKVAHDAYADS